MGSNSAEEFDVVVVGGGPTGLSLAYLLGRAGIRTALFEGRPGTSTLPKGQAVQAFTAELFRRWGIWHALKGAGWSTEASNGQGFYVRVSNGPVAATPVAHDHASYEQKWQSLTPAYPRKIPASHYEAALRQAAECSPSVHMHFAHRVTNVQILHDRVHVTVDAKGLDEAKSVRARFLVACDGAHSLVRRLLGRGQDQGPTFANQVLTEFRADLDHTLGRDGFFHSFILDPRYAGWFGSKHPDTGLWRYSFRHDEDALPSPDIVLARMRGALGMPDLPIEIVQTYRFDYTTGLLRTWREGPVFFAGDAAHWHSPWGGMGMNSGVHDANNLAWKLALVIRGAAGDQLLDTYEAERKSRALLTVKAATYNALNYQAIVESVRVGDGHAIAQGRLSKEGSAFLAERLISHSQNSILHTGYQLGTAYESSAAIRDGAELPPTSLAHYVESTVPGVRAPHAWLRDRNDERMSTTDLWGPGFVLLVQRDARAWLDAAANAQSLLNVEIAVRHVASDGDFQAEDGKFVEVFGSISNGALLVRPDGHVARRLAFGSREDARDLLIQTLTRILGCDTPSAAQIQALARREVQPVS